MKSHISRLGDANGLTSDQLVETLAEIEALTTLYMAEAVKTKLEAVKILKHRIERQEIENGIRDYISKHPWLIHPKWETFGVERGADDLLRTAAAESGIDADGDFKGRIDLALSGGEHLLILKFMRPGLILDWDHTDRFERYVRTISGSISANTGSNFNKITGYIIADKINNTRGLPGRIQALAREDMFVLDWPTLLSQAAAQWKVFLDILAGRDPQDERLRSLLNERTEQG